VPKNGKHDSRHPESIRTAGFASVRLSLRQKAANNQKTSAKAVIAITPKHINTILIGSNVRSLNMANSHAPHVLKVVAEDGAIVGAAWPRCDNSQEEDVIAGGIPLCSKIFFLRGHHAVRAAPILTNESRLPRAGKETWYSLSISGGSLRVIEARSRSRIFALPTSARAGRCGRSTNW
jgi:hypothetical protein